MGDIDEEAAEVWVPSTNRRQRYGSKGMGAVDKKAVEVWVTSMKRRWRCG